jgi:hypothetical protein
MSRLPALWTGSTTTKRLRALAGVHRVELPADPGPDAPIVLTSPTG